MRELFDEGQIVTLRDGFAYLVVVDLGLRIVVTKLVQGYHSEVFSVDPEEVSLPVTDG